MLAILLTALLSNLVVMAVLAVLVAGLSLIPVVRRYPVLRHWLWLIVLLKLITPPLIPIPVLPSMQKGVSEIDGTVRPRSSPLDQRATAAGDWKLGDLGARDVSSKSPGGLARHAWILWLAVFVSGMGATFWLIVAWRQVKGLHRALRHGVSDDERLHLLASQTARKMGIALSPAICVVNANISPLLWIRRGRPVQRPERCGLGHTSQSRESILAGDVGPYPPDACLSARAVVLSECSCAEGRSGGGGRARS